MHLYSELCSLHVTLFCSCISLCSSQYFSDSALWWSTRNLILSIVTSAGFPVHQVYNLCFIHCLHSFSPECTLQVFQCIKCTLCALFTYYTLSLQSALCNFSSALCFMHCLHSSSQNTICRISSVSVYTLCLVHCSYFFLSRVHSADFPVLFTLHTLDSYIHSE